MKKNLYIIVSAIIFLMLHSCHYTKLVPPNQKLLWKNTIYVNGEKGAPDEAENIIKQQPNAHFWIFAPKLGIYNWGNGNDSNFFSRIGEAPVLVDTSKVATGANQLLNWYFNKGYFNASSSYRIDSLKSKKAEAIYYVKTGERYSINEITKDIKTKKLRDLTGFYMGKESPVHEGDPYDADELEELRTLLAQQFRNNGFYNFSRNNITFEADTFLQGNKVNINLVIAQKSVESGDTSYFKDHEQYYINEIFIRPDNFIENPTPPDDSLIFQSYNFEFDTLPYKPRYITDAIHFEEGEMYSEEKVNNTYSHLVGYRAFKVTDIGFEPGPRDTSGPTLISRIKLTPDEKRTWSLEPEVTNSGGNFGLNGSTGWINRNFLGAGETFELRFSTGLEFQATPEEDAKKTLAFEIGGEISLLFPRFLLPFNTVGLLPKRMQPKSRVSLSYSKLSRPDFFKRNTFGAKISYFWNESARKAHSLDLADITYSQIYDVDPGFTDLLSDIQRQAFTDEFISATRYTYTLNEQLITRRKNPRFFKGSLEVAGNTLSLLDNSTDLGSTLENGAKSMFKVQYFQYAKIELDGRYYWNFGRQRSWVNRIYTGYIYPYGNSKIETDTGIARIPPFSKYFYMGGSNDMRAWTAYRLGAGTSFNTNYAEGSDTTFATGTFKLLIQTEYRFPILSILRGAVFVDAGNIWLTGGLEDEQTDLKFDDMYNQLALGTGVGLRLDLDFFVVRFDIGMKMRDPALLETGEEWVIFTQPAFVKNWTYNIALGYPF